ncbi:hypothetical protein ACP4OV_016602 [Aristida adscensionis]
MTYASVSQEAGEDIFNRTAKELYLMKHEKKDVAQFNSIVEGVMFCDYLFTVKLEKEAFCDNKFPKFSIVKAEKVNPLTESSRLLREINNLLQEKSGPTMVPRTSMGTKTGLSDLEARRRVQNSWTGYPINIGGARSLVSQTDSNNP